MAVEIITRVTKEAIKTRLQNEIMRQFYQFAFPTEKNTLKAGIELDKVEEKPRAMRVIKNGEPSVTRLYDPGSGQIYKPYISSEKTPIDQQLVDAVLSGIEPTANNDQINDLLDEIVKGPNGFVQANWMQRNKAAIDFFREGKFMLTDVDDKSTEYELDFGRDSTLDQTFNFTTDGGIDDLLDQMLQAVRKFGIPTMRIGVILGRKIMREFELDDNVDSKMKWYQRDPFINQIPPVIANVDGLHAIGKYRPSQSLISLEILGYEPQFPYRINDGSAEDFLPDDEVILMDLTGSRKRYNCGILVTTDRAAGKAEMKRGDLVLTNTYQDDPPTWSVIAKSRYVYTGEVDHTCRCLCSGFTT